MKKWTVILVFMLSSLVVGAESNNTGSDYIYCNVYVDSFCFGVVQKDKLKFEIPYDFLSYIVNLSFGGEVRVYYGSHIELIPQDLIKSGVCKEASHLCDLFKTNAGDYRILYALGENDPILDVRIYIKDSASLDSYSDFLSNFRSCKRSGESILCSKASLFSSIARSQITDQGGRLNLP